MKRREFLAHLNQLILLGAAGGMPGLTLLPTRVRADEIQAPMPKNLFVMICAQGGWDVTLGLDPRIHADGSEQSDMFIEYRPEEILANGDLRLGPACAPILPYASDVAVINGIFMSDSNVSHDANLDYITTGNILGQAPDLSAELAYASSVGPFGVVFNRSLKRANRALMPTTIDNLTSLKKSVDVSALQGLLSQPSPFNDAQKKLTKSAPARQRLIDALSGLKNEIDNSPLADGTSNGQMAAIVAAAFASRSAYQAKLDFSSGNLDTHSAHPGNHLKAQTQVWAAVANMFRIFKKVALTGPNGEVMGSLFDHTTFMVVSDFARTPELNAAQGKDHNPLTNSVLLAGAGVKGGRSFGSSQLITRKNSASGSPRFSGGPIDYATGAIPKTNEQARNSNFQFIFPENVASTVVEIVGADRDRFGNIAASTPFIPTLVRV
jgi:uncharacterized protein (DUF1501 family)